jgi:hypothetical protein
MTSPTKAFSSTTTIHLPLKFATRGGRKTIIGQIPHVARPRLDDALIRAIARAHRWRIEIENGNYSSITELAKTKGVNQSYASRVLRLTLLSPEIIEAVLNRRMPNLTLDVLMRPQPSRWDAQMASLQIND